MSPKSCTGPTRLARSEPNPMQSVTIAPTVGQSSTEIARSIAAAGERPESRCRRNSTIRCTTVAIPTTVIIAESIAETIVSFSPATARMPRVLQRASKTTAIGTTSHRRLRKQARITPPESRAEAIPSTRPSRSSIAKPSRSIAGSPATVPRGSSRTTPRIASTASARAVSPSTHTTPAVRRSFPTT